MNLCPVQSYYNFLIILYKKIKLCKSDIGSGFFYVDIKEQDY